MKWLSLSGASIPDIHAFVREKVASGHTDLKIGTDSLQTGRFTQFVTVVVFHRPTKGGVVAFTRLVQPRIVSMRERLFREVLMSVQLAIDVNEYLPKSASLEVHIDATTDLKYASSSVVKELVGMVMGQGFRYSVKPDAWVSTHVADHIVRTSGRCPREVGN